MTNPESGAQNAQQDPYTVIRNLHSACTELEQQNNWMRTRAAENACRADRAQDRVQQLETELAELRKSIEADKIKVADAP